MSVAYRHASDLHRLRQEATAFALDHGMTEARAAELAVVVSELTTNTLRHTSGPGRLRMWAEPGAVVIEISDTGSIPASAGGAIPAMPAADAGKGFGLALAASLSDGIHVQPKPVCVRARFKI